jgi:ethanolamine ammonia-lyase large subunit
MTRRHHRHSSTSKVHRAKPMARLSQRGARLRRPSPTRISRHTIDATSYAFDDLRILLARASPPRSGDRLAGIAADSAAEMIAARLALADVPLKQFLDEPVIPYEDDEVTRLILDSHDVAAFLPVSSLTVGGFRDWLLSDAATGEAISRISRGVTPEMVAAVSKLMRNQDLILVAKKCEVTTRFRNTVGLRGRMSTRLQPNHPFDDAKGITASILDGLLLGSGDACIGINPASDDPNVIGTLLRLLDDVITRLGIPTQGCVLTHVTTTLGLIGQGLPVDLVFQSIAGTEAANRSFGVDLSLLREAREAGLSLRRGTVGDNVMYFETGQGSALSANAHHQVDQQTCEARAYAVARAFDPLLVNSVVGFIGPEYLYDGKEIIRAGLEDHFCGKLLGLPLGIDVCYTNHAEADQDDMDNLLTLLAAAGVNFIMGVPGADDVMLNYQSTSFHDALYVRDLFGLKRAPEFDDWLARAGLAGQDFRLVADAGRLPDLAARLLT